MKTPATPAASATTTTATTTCQTRRTTQMSQDFYLSQQDGPRDTIDIGARADPRYSYLRSPMVRPFVRGRGSVDPARLLAPSLQSRSPGPGSRGRLSRTA